MDSAKKKKTPGKKAFEKKPLKKPKKITESYLHNSGLYYLQRFAPSRSQFRDVMLRKVRKSCMHHTEQNFEACAAMVDETIKKFERAGLLNDELYTQGAVSSLRRSGKSKSAILMKLKTRGIPADLALQKLENHDSTRHEKGDIIAALMFLRKKRIGAFGKEPETKHLSALARAGFSCDTAQYVLKMGRDEAEEILSG